jgi:Family of unknown function (DUF6941)
MNEAPFVQYMILCKDARLEGPKPRRLNIYGLMTHLRSPKGAFPAPIPEFCTLLALRNGRGSGEIVISAVCEDTGAACWNSAPQRINFGTDPLETRWLNIRIKKVVVPNAGVYFFEFRYDGIVLASQSLVAVGS